MWRIWRLFDPMRAMVAQAVFLLGLAVLIHLMLLGTNKYNWMDGAKKAPVATANAPVPAEVTSLAQAK